MKQVFLVIAGAALLLPFASLTALAEPTPQPRTINVTGEAEIRVVPDEVLISLTAETKNTDLMEAKQENDTTIQKLLDYATSKLDIGEEHIQTDMVSIEPSYRQCRYEDEMRGQCNPLDIVFFTVRKGIQIRLRNPDLYENLITEALKLGVSHIDNVQFISTELRKHRDQARELAAKAAQEKAQAVASALGMTLAKPVTINTGNFFTYYGHHSGQRGRGQQMMQNVIQESGGAPGGNGAATLALGQINITASVTVTFEIK